MRALLLAVALVLGLPLAQGALPAFSTSACGGTAPEEDACTTGSHALVQAMRLAPGEGFVGALWSQLDEATASSGVICDVRPNGQTTCLHWGTTRLPGADRAFALHTCGTVPPDNTRGFTPGTGAWTCEIDSVPEVQPRLHNG